MCLVLSAFALTGAPAQAELRPGDAFKDCADCPEMVVVPAGNFTMGSSAPEQALANAGGLDKTATDREGPQHSVSIKGFAAGRYAVTKGEFAKFVNAKNYLTDAEQGNGCYGWTGTAWRADKAYSWRSAGFVQGDDHPAVCVSWNDAQAYAHWVSQISGKQYRLLSEAEREYAARGGTQTAFWWGESISTAQANYDGSSKTGKPYNGSPTGEYRKATMPVGSFSANPFGLYNVHGNVWEWTGDCLHQNYSGAPTDGSAWTTACSNHAKVLRGGAWVYTPAVLRAANRSGDGPNIGFAMNGFRVARSLLATQSSSQPP